MSSLIHKANVKRYLLERIKQINPTSGDKFTRVSSQAYEDIEYRLRKVCEEYLRAQRIGKTITTP